MPRIEQFRCDCGCNAIKQVSNHWRMIRIINDAWSICDWDDNLIHLADVMYAAGQECAHRMLDQFMSKESLDS